MKTTRTPFHRLETFKMTVQAMRWALQCERDRSYPEPKEIHRWKKELRAVAKNARIMGELPHVQVMAQAVEKHVEAYHRDFYLCDLDKLKDYTGKAVWYVGACGTHLVTLNNADPKTEERERKMLQAIEHNYVEQRETPYRRYLIDTEKQTCKLMSYDRVRTMFEVDESIGA